MRETFVVDVPLRRTGPDIVSWLDLRGKETEERDGRAQFTFHLWPTGREEMAIQVRLDDINGGIGQTVDLERGLRNTHAGIVAALERQIWPEGRPETEDPVEKKAHTEKLAIAYALIGMGAADDDEEAKVLERRRNAYDRMASLRDQQEMAAAWSVLIVDPPDGWKDIAERELRSSYREALTSAFVAARDAKANEAGK
jgi:hypothetical protein